MRVAVTGASGFIGTHLARALSARGDDVVAIVRPSSETRDLEGAGIAIVRTPLTDAATLAATLSGADAVAHLAGGGLRDRRATWEANAQTTRVVIDACRSAGVRRLLLASTVTVTRRRVAAYGASKREAERLVRESGLEWTIVRLAFVYGPGRTGVFARLTQIARTLPVVPVVGSGKLDIAPIHVDDVVAGCTAALDRSDAVGKIYTLAGPQATFDDVVDGVMRRAAITKRKVHLPARIGLVAAIALERLPRAPLTRDNVLGMVQEADHDTSLARAELSFDPRPLDEGLDATFAWRPPPRRPNAPLQAAVVGLGRMGVAHAALLNTLPDVRIVALVDADRKQRKQALGLGLPGRAFAAVSDALRQDRIDVVYVCTPPSSHLSIGREAIEAGAAVFIEKPLAHTLADARELAALAAAHGTVTACGYHHVHFPLYERLRELLADDVVGDVLQVRVTSWLEQVLEPKRSWWYEPRQAGGGVLIGFGAHHLFLLDWLFGPVRLVSATTRRVYSDQVEDEAELDLAFANGVRGRFETSWSKRGHTLPHVALQIEGKRGTIEGNEERLVFDLERGAAGLQPGRTALHSADVPGHAEFDLGGEAYWLESRAFAAQVCGETEDTRLAWPAAVRTQAVVAAAYRSATTGMKEEVA